MTVRTIMRRAGAALATFGLLAGTAAGVAPPAAAAAAGDVGARAVSGGDVAGRAGTSGSRTGAAEATRLRIMPLGDSITWGVGTPAHDSYRTELYRRLTAAGLRVDFVGSQASGSGPDRDNEGHRGWTIGQIAQHVQAWLDAYEPDVVLLHIGTNDVTKGLGRPATRLSDLLDRIHAARPETRVLVAKIIGRSGWGQAATDAYNARIDELIARKGAPFRVVDLSGVGGVDLYDRVHPNEYGYATMAWSWYRALEPVLNATGVPWPAAGDPNRRAVSTRCLGPDYAVPQGRGCHRWYRRRPPGAVSTRVWQLPVRTVAPYRVMVDGKTVVRSRVVLRWITG